MPHFSILLCHCRCRCCFWGGSGRQHAYTYNSSSRPFSSSFAWRCRFAIRSRFSLFSSFSLREQDWIGQALFTSLSYSLLSCKRSGAWGGQVDWQQLNDRSVALFRGSLLAQNCMSDSTSSISLSHMHWPFCLDLGLFNFFLRNVNCFCNRYNLLKPITTLHFSIWGQSWVRMHYTQFLIRTRPLNPIKTINHYTTWCMKMGCFDELVA